MGAIHDADLLRVWSAGDQEAFAVLVSRHHGLVRAACQRAAPVGEADDCVQAVFLVLARRREQALRAPALEAWLLRTAHFVCRSACRARARRHRAESTAAAAAATASVGITAMAEHPTALAHLDACIQLLSDRQRVAVTMRYLADRPAEEIAVSLGTNANNVHQLLHRALDRLRTLLDRRGVGVASMVALTALLAEQTQAATAAASSDLVVRITTAHHSIAAVSLAGKTITAMNIAAILPYACAALLCIATAVATTVATAEHATSPPPQLPAAAAPSPPVAPERTVAAPPLAGGGQSVAGSSTGEVKGSEIRIMPIGSGGVRWPGRSDRRTAFGAPLGGHPAFENQPAFPVPAVLADAHLHINGLERLICASLVVSDSNVALPRQGRSGSGNDLSGGFTAFWTMDERTVRLTAIPADEGWQVDFNGQRCDPSAGNIFCIRFRVEGIEIYQFAYDIPEQQAEDAETMRQNRSGPPAMFKAVRARLCADEALLKLLASDR